MKSCYVQLSLLLFASLVLTGCYTQFNTTSANEKNQAVHVEGGWFEVNDALFYIDYPTRQWYSYYGIDLATDRNFLQMAYFRYHHPISPISYSPFRRSMFYCQPEYSNMFFFRDCPIPSQGLFTSHHPPYYSNPYMWSFYYNKWDLLWFRQETSHFNQARAASQGYRSADNANNTVSFKSTGRSAGNDSLNARDRSAQPDSRLSADRADLLTFTSRDRINPPAIERVSIGEGQRKIRDRRGSEYRNNLDRNRSRSPISSWNNWEQRNNRGDRITNRTRSTVRTSSVNRAGTTRSSDGSKVRGSSNRNSSSSGSATRSSGSNRSSGDSSSSSRGNN